MPKLGDIYRCPRTGQAVVLTYPTEKGFGTLATARDGSFYVCSIAADELILFKHVGRLSFRSEDHITVESR